MIKLLHTVKRVGEVILEADGCVRVNLLQHAKETGASPPGYGWGR